MRLVRGCRVHGAWPAQRDAALLSNNTAGLRAYAKAGFKLIGRRRESRRQGAERVDTVFDGLPDLGCGADVTQATPRLTARIPACHGRDRP